MAIGCCGRCHAHEVLLAAAVLLFQLYCCSSAQSLRSERLSGSAHDSPTVMAPDAVSSHQVAADDELSIRENLRAALKHLTAHPEDVSSLLDVTEASNLRKAVMSSIGQEAPSAAPSVHQKEAPTWFSLQAWQHGAPSFVAIEEDPNPEKNSSNLFGIDLSKIEASVFTPLLVVMAFTCVVGCIAFEIGHSRHYRESVQRSSVDLIGDEAHELKLPRLFAGIVPLLRPYICQNKDRTSWWYISVVLTLGIWELALNFVYTLWVKDFWDVIENKRFEKFKVVMKVFALLLSTLILVSTYRSYVSMMFIMHWRTFMTDWFMRRWLAHKTYYRMQLEPNTPWLGQSAPDNPDQRMQEDIQVFITTFLDLTSGFLASFGKLFTMLPMLLVLSPVHAFGVFYCPGWLLYMALLYSGIGTVAAHWIGRKLILINFARQKYEANFRYNIVQVRDNAESIALYNSERCEERRLKDVFQAIVHVWYLLMVYTKRLTFFTAFYQQTSFMFPYIVLAPSYFKGQISLGAMFMLFRALGSVKDAFDWVISVYPSLTDFRATVDRLHNFQCALDAQELASVSIEKLSEVPPESRGAVLSVSEMTVQLPKYAGAKVLWQEVNLEVLPGQFVLLTAPEGSGKSCFFRAISGIWPTASGKVYTPEETLFVPQKSFIPQGSLKQAIAYPECENYFTDAAVKDVLKAVGLSALAAKDLHEEGNWQMVLSGGEQQRLAIAHAALKKPRLLFLDEATSAMGREGALEIYQLLRKEGTLPKGAAVVSISHQLDLLGVVHDIRYTYSPDKAVWVEALET